jgi:hypothetical protein
LAKECHSRSGLALIAFEDPAKGVSAWLKRTATAWFEGLTTSIGTRVRLSLGDAIDRVIKHSSQIAGNRVRESSASPVIDTVCARNSPSSDHPAKQLISSNRSWDLVWIDPRADRIIATITAVSTRVRIHASPTPDVAFDALATSRKPNQIDPATHRAQRVFNTLIRASKVDLPAATLREELLKQGLVTKDADGTLHLLSEVCVPTRGDDALRALEATLADHMRAAITNATTDGVSQSMSTAPCATRIFPSTRWPGSKPPHTILPAPI